MEGVLLAADTVCGIIFVVAAVLAALPSRNELVLAKRLVVIGAILMTIRWTGWAAFSEAPWPWKAAAGAVIGAALFALLPAAIHWLNARLTATATANISFQRYALFWVSIEKDVYQLGAIAKFVNLGTSTYVVDGLSFDQLDLSIYPRGSYLIQRILGTECRATITGDYYIKPNSEAYFKTLLPIKAFMIVNGGDSPELIIRGNWNLAIDGAVAKELPEAYSVFPQFISIADWDSLGTSKPKIQVDDLHYKPIPPRPSNTGPYDNYLVFNSDRTATIDNVYFAQTSAIKGPDGVMLFIRGSGPPPLGIGWSVLGRTYHEVWSDPGKLRLYNSLFPPGEDGKPKPFGFFAGVENEMAGPMDRQLFAPTTVAADIMEFNVPCPK